MGDRETLTACESTSPLMYRNCRRCRGDHCHCAQCLSHHHASLRLMEKAARLLARARVRAKMYEVSVRMTLSEFRQWLTEHSVDDCAMCHAPGEQVDHIVPMSRGGHHVAANLQMLCSTCNAIKGASLPTDTETAGWRRFTPVTSAIRVDG